MLPVSPPPGASPSQPTRSARSCEELKAARAGSTWVFKARYGACAERTHFIRVADNQLTGCFHSSRFGNAAGATFAEARAYCESFGARMCALDELPASHGTGCNYNTRQQWTSDAGECGPGFRLVATSHSSAWRKQKQCRAEAARVTGVSCCADPASLAYEANLLTDGVSYSCTPLLAVRRLGSCDR